MAADERGGWHAPLKAPANSIEVVELSSEDEGSEPAVETILQTRDAFERDDGSIIAAQTELQTTIVEGHEGDLEEYDEDNDDDGTIVAAQTKLQTTIAEGDSEDYDEDNDDDDQESQLSMYEDFLDAAADTDDSSPPDTDGSLRSDYCTPEESASHRKKLRLMGEDAFIQETLRSGSISARKLCTAFGARIPFWLEEAPDEAFYPLLNILISKELSRRVKLPQHNTFDDAVTLLQRSKNIVVLTGAGISTSLGIPDFRSKDHGLYAQLEHLGLSDPQEVFDINMFREDPSIFYSVAKDILPSTNRFTPTHAFIRLLQDKDKLLTNFTQNIDNLEQHAGIKQDKLIQCHGSFAKATCIECKHKVKGEVIYDDMKAGRVPKCQVCLNRLKPFAPSLKRKRDADSFAVKGKKKKKKTPWDSSDEEGDDEVEVNVAGVMKPDITFFGEDLPATFHERLVNHDRGLVDLVIVIGTSLKVAPVSEVVGVIPSEVPQIYISREPCNHVEFDIDLLGDCDLVVTELARRAGWDLKHEMIENRKIEASLLENHESMYRIAYA